MINVIGTAKWVIPAALIVGALALVRRAGGLGEVGNRIGSGIGSGIGDFGSGLAGGFTGGLTKSTRMFTEAGSAAADYFAPLTDLFTPQIAEAPLEPVSSNPYRRNQSSSGGVRSTPAYEPDEQVTPVTRVTSPAGKSFEIPGGYLSDDAAEYYRDAGYTIG